MSRRNPYQFPKPTDGAQTFWRNLGETAIPTDANAEFGEGLRNLEVLATPKQPNANDPNDLNNASRRNFLAFAGSSAALAACARRPIEKILPYVKQPEYAIPGLSYSYATVVESRGVPVGLVVETHEGRPTKIDGNPEHPNSLGATDARTQGMIWDLYDADRSRLPLRDAKVSTWEAFNTAWRALVANPANVRVLVPPTSSPTLARLRTAAEARGVKFVTYASVSDEQTNKAAELAFGSPTLVSYALKSAKVVVALDSDFLGTEPDSVRLSKEFAASRDVRTVSSTMSRLYVVEPSLTSTGSTADHRFRVPAAKIADVLLALCTELATAHGVAVPGVPVSKGLVNGLDAKTIKAIAKDLAVHKSGAVVLVGSRQPANVQALAMLLNKSLGGLQSALPSVATSVVSSELKALAADMAAGKVDTLVTIGEDPARTMPADLKFAEAFKKVKTRIVFASHTDETSKLALWHSPRAHELESWGDALIAGTYSVQQPLIAPLHGGISDVQIYAALAGDMAKPMECVQETFKKRPGLQGTFEQAWNDALKHGVIAGQPLLASAREPKLGELAVAWSKSTSAAVSKDALEVTFAPHPYLYDGRHANNPWLLELPCPVSKLSWDNAAFISVKTAADLSLETGDMVRLSKDGVLPLDIAVFVLPGQGDNSLALSLGWGQQDVGRYGSKHGFAVESFRSSDTLGFANGVRLQKLSTAESAALVGHFRDLGKASEDGPAFGHIGPTGPFDVVTGRYRFVQTQTHHSMEGRPIAIDGTLEEFRANTKFVQFPHIDPLDPKHSRAGAPDPKVLPLWKRVDYSQGHKWGMAIDMNACTGCSACVVACQAENNVPPVGKEQVMRGREMSWLRIDRYFVGIDEHDPKVVFQPIACVQCEDAPCENVCPVNATEHSPEGLNDMSYNRCIGTRYCANNCPYKVRRFNYLNYNGEDGVLPDTEQMQKNPNVTIRMRGIMEKCSYCVQRIQEGKILARREGRALIDGDVRSACQTACPSDAIAFGDLNDPRSRVAELTRNDRAYRLLAEIGTKPRTSHLGKIRNPNPELV